MGSPGFCQIEGAGVRGALRGRRDLVAGQPTVGFECTLAVTSIDASEQAVIANGGTMRQRLWRDAVRRTRGVNASSIRGYVNAWGRRLVR